MIHSLPFELKLLIASIHEETWYHIHRYDPEFAKATNNDNVRRQFVKLFTKEFSDDHGKIKYKVLGKLHCEKHAAVECIATRDEEWYINGKRHRENGPAFMQREPKIYKWYNHGKLHRENGPAFETSHYSEWRINGELHREDGPATESRSECSWYLHGVFQKREVKPQKKIKKTTKVYLNSDGWYENECHSPC